MTCSKIWCCLLVVGLAIVLTAGIASAQETSTEVDTEAAAEEAQPDTSLADLLRSLETPVEEAAGPSEVSFLSRVKESGLVELFLKGGGFMYPLLIASIIGVAVIIERALTPQPPNVREQKVPSRRFFMRVLSEPNGVPRRSSGRLRPQVPSRPLSLREASSGWLRWQRSRRCSDSWARSRV